MERAVGDVGERGVLVAHKALEGAAVQTEQAEAADAGTRFGRLNRFSIAHQFDAGMGAFRATGLPCAGQQIIRDFFGGELHAGGLRVDAQELRGEELTVRLQIVTRELEGLALDEILHGVRGDETGVVAGGVSGPEGVAVDQDFCIDAEDRTFIGGLLTFPQQAVGDDIAFAVVTLFRTACEVVHKFVFSSRKSAIR